MPYTFRGDEVLNEHIKNTADIMMPIYIKLFNKILDSGETPEKWLIGLIIPIYKQKGSKYDSNNYRGITLLSCLGKLYTSTLNERLYSFCEENKIVKEIQAGFRQGYSTIDHLFVMKNVIDMFIAKKKKLYCCFVDYSKAFDTVWRKALWHKLISYGIEGKIMNVMKNMYKQVKSCVFMNGEQSEYFLSPRGVRQGENLSPLLFALYVNDVEEYLLENNCKYINIDDNVLDKYMKLHVLMYADDTILLADNVKGLQKAIDCMGEYCDKWRLAVNVSKTKVLIFGKAKTKKDKYIFLYKGQALEIVDSYKYLGLTLNNNGSFKTAISNLKSQASRAMYSLLAKCRKLQLPLDLQLHLFDCTVVPILLYGCEIWGMENFEELEKTHRKFLKHILRVHGRTTNNMVYGELRRYPLDVQIKKRMIGFWARLITGKQSKLSKIMYDGQFKRYNDVNVGNKPKWISHIHSIFKDCEMNHVWDWQTFDTIGSLKKQVDKRLKELYITKWKNELSQMSSCDLYQHLKGEYKIEKYLLNLDDNLRITMCKFRTDNTRLPKVTGRYKRPKLERHQRICTLCDEERVGDEYHLLFECKNETIVRYRRRKNT